MSEAGPVVYDPVELRRRIVVCFSVGELRALADSLGVGGIAWERGLHEAAREMVRQCERYAGLPALVAKLREARPLVEWPEPAAPVAPGTIASTLAGGPSSAPPAAFAPPAALGFPTLPASPGSFGPPTGPALVDPYAPPPGSPAMAPPPVTTGGFAPRPPGQPAPPSGPPAGWPGVTSVGPEPARSGGIDPRIFVAVAGLMVLAAIIAYLAGRASSAPPATEAATAEPASSSARSDGPTSVVAATLARRFASMARICELPPSAGASAVVFQRIFERCGPVPPPQRPYTPPPVPTVAGAPSDDPALADPAPSRGKRSGGRGGDPAPAPAAPAKGCMGGCDGQHASCRAHCGAEPTESSAYDGFQRCLGRCLSDASRCRLGCR